MSEQPFANPVLSGADRHPLHSDAELVQRWLRAQKPARRVGTGMVLWGKVSHVFCIGSTSAKDVCRRHGFDPDFEVKRS